MKQATFLQRCKDLVGGTFANPWTPEHMAGFFQHFRPDGQQLKPLFDDIPAGIDVYNRLRQVYRATADGFQEARDLDTYFIIHTPQYAKHDKLTGYATAQLSNWRQIAAETNERELVELLTPIPQIRISSDEPPDPHPNDTESLDVFIHDVQTDWHVELVPQCPQAFWMQEAFYYIACDDYLAQYIMWPWYMNSTPIKDPFKPYFNLWLYGAELHCESPDNITLYIPSR